MADLLHNLGKVAEREGHVARAGSLYPESLTIFHALGDQWGMVYGLECMARVAATDGRALRALQLAGAASALREVTGALLRPAEQELHQHVLMRAKEMPTEPECASAWADGKLMALEQAVTCALEEPGLTKVQSATVSAPSLQHA